MERFGQFEILAPLGVGGMAETALAVRRGQDDFEQRVCLKRILPAFNKDPEFVRAFQNEARIAVRLVHPHVCRIYDFGNHEGTFWMSMEYLDGGDLRSLLENLRELAQPLPTDVVLLLALDIASALHYAHELRIDGKRQDIIHRDISPSNVLIDSTGHFKLADFGIAKGSASGEVTRSGVVKGKIPYMSPEHARGQKIDARADLWSFGVTLFEALAGERPFKGAHEVETLLAVTEGRRKKLLEVAPHTPPALAEVVERLLEPDVEKRMRRAADVIEALATTPPPANARLRLDALIQRIRDEQLKTDRRSISEAATAFAPDGQTSAAPEPTVLGPDGAAVGKAPAPVSAPPDAATREAQPLLVAMDTKALPPGAKPTLPEHTPSTGVRQAAAEAAAIDQALSAQRSPIPSVTETEAVATPFAATSPVRRLAQAVIALAVVGTLGLGALAIFARPSPPVTGAPSVTTASPPTEPAPETSPPTIAVTPTPIEPEPTPPAPIEPPSEGTTEPVLALEPATPVEAPAEEAPPVEATDDDVAGAEERAVLTIGSRPWAYIWLDGRRLGMGPITRRVAPGRHRIGVGQGDHPVASRVVVLEPGDHHNELVTFTP